MSLPSPVHTSITPDLQSHQTPPDSAPNHTNYWPAQIESEPTSTPTLFYVDYVGQKDVYFLCRVQPVSIQSIFDFTQITCLYLGSNNNENLSSLAIIQKIGRKNQGIFFSWTLKVSSGFLVHSTTKVRSLCGGKHIVPVQWPWLGEKFRSNDRGRGKSSGPKTRVGGESSGPMSGVGGESSGPLTRVGGKVPVQWPG